MTERTPRSFDDAFYDGLVVAAERLMRQGATQEQAVQIATQALDPALRNITENLTAQLHKTTPKMLRNHRRINRGFRRRLPRREGLSPLAKPVPPGQRY